MDEEEVTGLDWESRSEFWKSVSTGFARFSVAIVIIGVVTIVVAAQTSGFRGAVNTSNEVVPIDLPKSLAPQSQIPLIALYVSCASLAVSLAGMISSMMLGWRADRRAVAAAAAEAARRARSENRKKPRAP